MNDETSNPRPPESGAPRIAEIVPGDVPPWIQIQGGHELAKLVEVVRFAPGQPTGFLHSAHDAQGLIWRWLLKWAGALLSDRLSALSADLLRVTEERDAAFREIERRIGETQLLREQCAGANDRLRRSESQRLSAEQARDALQQENERLRRELQAYALERPIE